MKKFLFFLLLVFPFAVFSQYIVVNDPNAPETALSAEDLIKEVLIGGNTCANVEITELRENPAGINNLNVRSWGYFDATGTNFPFERGIILSSGFARGAQGPNNSSGTTGSGTGWGGDDDLRIILNNQSNDNASTNNATVFQFTFIPTIEDISFDFIFASEEYENDFECTSQFRDGFAFLLRGPGIPDNSGTPYGGINIAAIPGSANIPVSTLSIHADSFTCGSEVPGVNFFPDLYVSNWGVNNTNEIQYDGYTLPLTAQTTLIPGETYELKMVIADRGDDTYDSAVFFRAGSFNIGEIDLGEDLTLENESARCQGEFYTITYDEAPSWAAYEWQYEEPFGSGIFVPFDPPEIANSVNIYDEGLYKLIVNLGGTCEIEGTIYIEFDEPLDIDPDLDIRLEVCAPATAGGINWAGFDLRDADDEILMGDPDLIVASYHRTPEAAEAGSFPIDDDEVQNYVNDTSPYLDTVYARVESAVSSCSAVVPVNLEVRNSPDIVAPEPLILCDDNEVPGVGREEFNLRLVEPEVLNGLNPDEYDFYYYTEEADAITAGESAFGDPQGGDFSFSIPTPEAYVNINQFNETIYILVVGNEDNEYPNTTPPSSGAGCYTIVELELIVNPLPDELDLESYEVCADAPNGITTFDLTDIEGYITNNDNDLFVAAWYYWDADAGDYIQIPDPTEFENFTNPQNVWAEVTYTETLCSRMVMLQLVVHPNPTAIEPTPLEACGYNGWAQFNLEDKTEEIRGGNAALIVTYHEMLGNAENGIVDILDPEDYENIVQYAQTIYVRAENNFGCYDIVELELIVNEPPSVPLTLPDYIIYSAVATGVEFNLWEHAADDVYGSNYDPDVDVLTFHLSQEDAEAGTAAIPNIFFNTTNPQLIWYRLTEDTTGCAGIGSFWIRTILPPDITDPTDLVYCDDVNEEVPDGITVFDLTEKYEEIVGTQIWLDIQYYEDEQDALDGNEDQRIDPDTAYENTDSPYLQTLYVRVVHDAVPQYSYNTTLTLRVLRNPNILYTPEPIIAVCGNDETVDLTQNEVWIISQEQQPVEVTYHFTEDDAHSGDSPVDTADLQDFPIADLPPSGIVYIRVAFEDTGCYGFVEQLIIINPLPEADEEVEDYILCILPGETPRFNLLEKREEMFALFGLDDEEYTITFHAEEPHAESGINALQNLGQYQIPGGATQQTIWYRVENDDTQCFIIGQFDLEVRPGVTLTVPDEPFETCENEPETGIGTFDLTLISQIILDGEDPDEYIITYHETEEAESGTAIQNPEEYVSSSGIIYVRIESVITGCYIIAELELLVNPLPLVPLQLDDLVVCSPDQIGVEFDLWSHAYDAVYGFDEDYNEDDYTLTFHFSEEDAREGADPLDNPYLNEADPQQIWFRLTNNETGCGGIGWFWILTALSPDIIDPTDFELCDDLGEPFDGFTVFNLTLKNNEITDNRPWLDVQYYENEIDALEGNVENRIPNDTEYENIEGPEQILYVRVFDKDAQCPAFTTLTIRVLPNPDILTPDPIGECHDDEAEDGTQNIDLTQNQEYIENGEQNVIVTYHLTEEEAHLGENAIDNPEDYEIAQEPSHQIFYVRVTFDTDEPSPKCYEIVEQLVIINPLPMVEPGDIGDYILCIIDAANATNITFNLVEKREEILDLFDPEQDDYTVTYHWSEDAAEAGIQAIPEWRLLAYVPEGSLPETIYYRIVNITGCFVTGEFILDVREGVTAVTPDEPMEACEDEEGSGIGTFNLTLFNPVILDGQDPEVYLVTYHETEEDAENGIAIENPEEYASPSQTIYARVSNHDESSQGYCNEIVEVMLWVNPIPEVTLLDEYRLCVDEDGNVIPEEFGAVSPPVIETGLDANAYAFVWLVDGSVLFGENGPSVVVQQGGQYTVIVTDVETGCENTATTTVVLSSPPLVYGAEATGAFSNEHIIEAFAEGHGEYMFRLDDGPYQDNGVFTGVTPGVHIVTITDINGCGSVQVEVGVIDYPLFFTPNNDGYNDTWNIIGIGADPTAEIYIFDRHGKLLKQLSPNGPGWDGTYNGAPLPSSDYWFRVVYTEEGRKREYSGHFTLKR